MVMMMIHGQVDTSSSPIQLPVESTNPNRGCFILYGPLCSSSATSTKLLFLQYYDYSAFKW